jgi:hypothetical protein
MYGTGTKLDPHPTRSPRLDIALPSYPGNTLLVPSLSVYPDPVNLARGPIAQRLRQGSRHVRHPQARINEVITGASRRSTWTALLRVRARRTERDHAVHVAQDGDGPQNMFTRPRSAVVLTTEAPAPRRRR